jgi:phage host-nuclease inhibitor protein Gam
MKKLVLSFVAASMLMIVVPAQLKAEDVKTATVTTEVNTEVVAVAAENSESNAEMIAEVRSLIDRLDEIREMNISEMNFAEKRELRKEVKSINKDLAAFSKADSQAQALAEGQQMRGVYISGGAIIIILLLILLL